MFLADVSPLVHATGINWDAVIAISASVVVTMSVIIGAFARWISSQITKSIDRFRIEVIQQLSDRLTRLETLAEIADRRHIRKDGV